METSKGQGQKECALTRFGAPILNFDKNETRANEEVVATLED